ncbi:bifunctional 3-(3-hydroxy-phenyl)propionate/3-hydroxycinnamic acid hydroxylase [Kitasatospora sp. NPDC052896]|uniref:bifunctional 3-(3-hydroxy-phenyl)propionate/3-hydroxycinnamic acid hydroxylase n=1 Tax=Kitasatospora sp. NPDC052896 TaxID=3364061 RepID=UPI0037CB604C
MSTRQPRTVVIVGAGPVGVTAALLLAQRGIATVVLERHHDVYPLPRAVAMDDEVRRILQTVGVEEEFTGIARPGNGLRLLDARHRVMATVSRTSHGHHGFPQTSMFDQPQLERLLRDALAEHPEIELRGGVEVLAINQDPRDLSGPVRVTLRAADGDAPEQLWADAVLGCDGANSLTREAIGASWEDLRFEETWTVLDVRTTARVRCWEGVEQICDPARPATFMRVGEERYRWEFRLRAGEDLDGPDGARLLRELLAPWIELTPEADFEVLRRSRYTFRARVADRWRLGRVLLLGDAAHLTPPFIGQGLCSGLRDAANLTWKLARVLTEGADERLLDTYQDERKPHVRHVIRLAVAMGWAMTGGQDRAAAVRRSVLGAACRIPGLTAAVGRDLSPPLKPGPLVRRAPLPGRRLAGTLCPQPWVVTADGRRTRLDDLLGDAFTLLTAVPPSPSLRAAADAVGARVIRIGGRATGPDETAVRDDGTLGAWLRRGRADAVLLRPDRVVLDSVPAGRRERAGLDTTTWAPLLSTAHHPRPRAADAPFPPPPRSTAR